MEHHVGLDVSLKLTAICIVDGTGKIEREGVVADNVRESFALSGLTASSYTEGATDE